MGPAILFCPSDRPDRNGMAMNRADAVILDLEEAVAPVAREQALQSLLANPTDPNRTIVRITPSDTDDF
jgi:citrate lyase subunit beta/citryl-CoA lyase